MKLGLTLSGGGARGAYEAGVVRALAEENVKLHAVSGASIGALNGALVAASPTLSEAADRLEHLWKELGEIELLKEMIDIKLIAAAGARLIIPSPIRFVAGYLYQLLVGKNELFAEFDNNGLLTNKPLRDILNTWISDDALEAGIPLHVSVYEKYSTPQALLAAISSVSGYGDTPHSRYRCLQDMPRHLRRKALLASAALPFVFASQQINGSEWIDGGLGDNLGETGNTPTTPLIEAGCNVIIVTLLQNGSFWNRTRSPDTTFLEIRPSGRIPSGPMSLIDFSSQSISDLYSMGYEDAARTLRQTRGALEQAEAGIEAKRSLHATLAAGEDSRAACDQAMERLKKLHASALPDSRNDS